MNEENNRKGPGVFYAVVGVATLVVAIIGATFAYFSASAESGANAIQGSTRNLEAGSLTLSVEKVTFNNTGVANDDLVPAFFGGSAGSLTVPAPGNLTETQVRQMLSNKCVQGGYTGCHIWRITVDTDEAIPAAFVRLTLDITSEGTKDKAQWGYVVFTGSETMNTSDNTKTDSLTLTALNQNNGAPAAIDTGVNAVDIHNGAALTTDGKTYYLLVYVNDTDVSQNTTETTGNYGLTAGNNNYVIGSYAGSVVLDAVSGGKVRATFTSGA